MAKTTSRDARPEDRPSLVAFMAALQDYERGLHSDRSDGAGMASDHLAYLEQLVAEQEGFILVAESGDGLVGLLVALVETLDPRDRHIVESKRRYGWVTDLFVRPERRGLGLGTRLLEVAEERFREQGLNRVMISMLAANDLAARTYNKAGYRAYEVTLEKAL